MRVLGIIPARGGSKGIPRKNIKILNNKPLLAYTAESALNSKKLSLVILSSDDDEIISVGKKINLEAPFIRPEELASDSSATIDVIIHAIEFYQEENIYFDAVCILQVTNPFRARDFIDKAIKVFEEKNTDSLISVIEVPHEYNPHWVFEEKENSTLKIATGEKEIISRRQDLPKAFIRDGSIYITKTKVILEKRSLFGDSISYIESDANRHVNIDTFKDWKKAEELAKKIF